MPSVCSPGDATSWKRDRVEAGMEDIVAIIFIFGGGTLFALSVSPIGRAIASRIRGEGASSSELESLRETQLGLMDEIESMRQELSDVQERVDFAERLLAQHRDAPGLPGSQEPRH